MPGFLIGIVVGAVAASAYLKKKGAAQMGAATLGSSRSSAMDEGRVDELSSAASMPSPETAPLNAGDGTSSGMSRPSGSSQGSATGLAENRY